MKKVIVLMLLIVVFSSCNNIESFTETVNGVSFKMVAVEGGTFMMGENMDKRKIDKEGPAHSVTLDDYYIGEIEVTQELWMAIMGTSIENKSGHKSSYYKVDPNYSMGYVSWDDCQRFIEQLNKLTGKKYGLPTEAQWEYAARGGNKSNGYKYSGSDDVDEVAWVIENSGMHINRVKSKLPNELGLYDMSGNMEEWCQDWYGPYLPSDQINPLGPADGSSRVTRGGAWLFPDKSSQV